MERDLLKLLNTRLSENETRPVLLTGVHGCGKTTLGAMFAKRFAQSMAFNLSKAPDRQAFANIHNGEMHFPDIYLHRSRDPRGGRTLLFIDDVHAAPEVWEAVTGLANRPHDLFILGATDVADRGRRTEDGSTQYSVHSTQSATFVPHPSSFVLRPHSFPEFLSATGETEALASYLETPCPDFAHARLLSLFHRYIEVGGMPETINAWKEHRNMVMVEKAFDRILSGWERLIRQEVRGRKSAGLAISLFVDAFPYASARISFNGFANKAVRSREASNAFRRLEELMLLQLVHPVTGTGTDQSPDTGRSPRLQFADTGMVVHLSGIRHQVSETPDLTGFAGGQVIRHVVGQELLTRDEGRRTKDDLSPRLSSFVPRPSYWVSPKLQSHAEVDFVIPFDGMMIPVVVRSGEPGRLRSLHSFLNNAPHPYAVRLCAERLSVRKSATVSGKPFYLLSLPYHLAGRISEHLDGFIKYVSL